MSSQYCSGFKNMIIFEKSKSHFLNICWYVCSVDEDVWEVEYQAKIQQFVTTSPPLHIPPQPVFPSPSFSLYLM